jgi:glutaredoxin
MKVSVVYVFSVLGSLGYASAAFRSSFKLARMVSQKSDAETTRLRMSVPNPLDTFSSGLASIFRLQFGVTASSNIKPNEDIRLIKLYDIENSLACRSVRERVTELDLVIEKVIPAAENSRATSDPSYEDALPSGAAAPCLVVSLPSGEQKVISGDSNILEFLDESYPSEISSESASAKSEPLQDVFEVLKMAGSYAAGWMRPGRGSKVSPAVTSSPSVNRPKKPLILYSYEGNQFCRLVREVLTELDIVYELRSAGKESPRRAELAERNGGSTICPYIVDPNTDVSMAESADIIRYLYDTYALWTPPNELLEWASASVMPILKPMFAALAPMQAGSKDEDEEMYRDDLDDAVMEIEHETASAPVVVYTYELSPFSFEAKALLDSLKVAYKEVSLGQEWVPGLLAPGGAIKRAALLEMTGQSSLPHIFVGGKPIGGLFSGEPGLLPALREGQFLEWVQGAEKGDVEAITESWS